MNQDLKRLARTASRQQMDDYDRIHLHIMDGKVLPKRLQKLMKQAEIVYPLLCSGWDNLKIVKWLDAKGVCKRSRAYILIRKTKRIFGDAAEANKQGDRAVLIEMNKKAYRLAYQKGDAKAMVAANKEIAKLQGHYDKEDSLIQLFEKLTLPAVTFTDDARILQAKEVEFEDVEE